MPRIRSRGSQTCLLSVACRISAFVLIIFLTFSTFSFTLNPAANPPPRDFTIVASCKLTQERLDIFETAFLSWLSVLRVSKIIIVDWQSAIHVEDTVHKYVNRLHGGRTLSILRVMDNRNVDWRIGAAFNLGLQAANSLFILKVDCDTFLAADFLKHNNLSNVGFRYGDWSKASIPGDSHLNGVFLARREDLIETRAFDERLSVYGWDDSDLYLRLESHVNSKEEVLKKTFDDFIRSHSNNRIIKHIEHRRTADQAFELNGICFNRATLENITKWVNSSDAYIFNCLKNKQQHAKYEVSSCYLEKEARTVQDIVGLSNCERIATDCVNGYGGQPSFVQRICGEKRLRFTEQEETV
jgi:hypothetical protein